MHLIASIVLSLCFAPETPSDVTPFLESFVDAFNNLEWDRFRSHFSDDATVFFPAPYSSERASGRQSVEAGFRGVFERWKKERPGPPYLDIVPRDVATQSFGDVTVVTFHLMEGESRSRRTLVLHLEKEGLKIVHLHASSQ